MILLNEPIWILAELSTRVMVQVVSATLLQPLDPGVPSGSGTTEEAIGLELLLSDITIIRNRRIKARTEYTLLIRPSMRIDSMCKSFRSEKNFLCQGFAF